MEVDDQIPILNAQPLNIIWIINHGNHSPTTPMTKISSPISSLIPEDPLPKLHDLLNSLPDDLYTDPLHGYEPSIKFFTIKDNCLETVFSPNS